jgi:hypothetical protein
VERLERDLASSNAVLIVLDAAGARHFGCYGYPRATTPEIDRIASEGVVFQRAYTTAVYTRAAMGSIWTSRFPGSVSQRSKLPAEHRTLAELLTSRGIHTAGFVANAKAEPAVVRGLIEASFPFFGAVGLVMSALLLSSAGYATLATGALPKWTGWVAYGAAVANLAAAPSILVGPDYRAFYTATGYVTMIGQGLLMIWFAVASVSMILAQPPGGASTPVNGV